MFCKSLLAGTLLGYLEEKEDGASSAASYDDDDEALGVCGGKRSFVA